MAGGNGDPVADFTTARTFGGLALIVAAVLIALIDAVRVDVEIDPFQFFGIVGAGCLLLGVRGLERIVRP